MRTAGSIFSTASYHHSIDGRSLQLSASKNRVVYFFRSINGVSILACLFAFVETGQIAGHASRSPGALRPQSGLISLVTVRRSCQRSMTDGRPQNQ